MHSEKTTIRLVAVDMDGTLLHDDKSISDYTLDVLRNCRRAERLRNKLKEITLTNIRKALNLCIYPNNLLSIHIVHHDSECISPYVSVDHSPVSSHIPHAKVYQVIYYFLPCCHLPSSIYNVSLLPSCLFTNFIPHNKSKQCRKIVDILSHQSHYTNNNNCSIAYPYCRVSLIVVSSDLM